MLNKLLFPILFVSVLGACSSKRDQLVHQPMDERGTVQYQFAYDFFQNGDMVRALASALTAVELAPQDADVRNILGLIYFRRGEMEAAEKEFLLAAQLNPRMSEVHNNLGSLYYDLGRHEEALVALDKALLNPLYLNPERVHNNRGLVFEALGQKDQARAEYERAIFLRRNYYLPYQNLGKLFLSEANHESAREALQEAVRLCGECVEPRYYLGKALLESNLQAEATKIFKEGHELNPRSYYGQLCLDYLEQQN
jgi:type IV pilus biogenesis/stability protein PilW